MHRLCFSQLFRFPVCLSLLLKHCSDIYQTILGNSSKLCSPFCGNHMLQYFIWNKEESYILYLIALEKGTLTGERGKNRTYKRLFYLFIYFPSMFYSYWGTNARSGICSLSLDACSNVISDKNGIWLWCCVESPHQARNWTQYMHHSK